MKKLILAFQSTGDAIAGERKLLDAGVDVRVMPAPKSAGGSGGICLVINAADAGKARLLLGNSIRSACPETEDGKDSTPWLP